VLKRHFQMGKRSEAGMAYVVLLVLLAIMSALGFSFLFKVGVGNSATETRGAGMQAHYLAESAANHAIWRMLKQSSLAVDLRVTHDHDDAEEEYDGDMSLNHANMELGRMRYVGVRFLNVNIPQGATIVTAYIEFQAADSNTENTDLTIYGQDSDNASGFDNEEDDISDRPKTDASVTWNNVSNWTIHQKYQTPDFTPVIQEIVDRPGWSDGNDIAVLFRSTDLGGKRLIVAHDDNPDNAPLLHIGYSAIVPLAEDTYYMHSFAGGRYGYKIRWYTDTTFATIATVGAIGNTVVEQSYVLYVIPNP
jgi:hypothetical protein